MNTKQQRKQERALRKQRTRAPGTAPRPLPPRRGTRVFNLTSGRECHMLDWDRVGWKKRERSEADRKAKPE